MGVFTFVCRQSGGEWAATQLNGGEIKASADSTYELQRKLVHASIESDSSGGAVQTSFSYVTPSSAVFQVIAGGGVFVGGVAAAASGGGAAAEAPAAEEEKKEEFEEESDDDIMPSLFDD
ncbi:Large ribosomal subunit protein P3z [Castilleja foliolosa]|uniref:Large ribosomal subunit protein P3z n=1 Tax=Castilleja foliolosa TaxID=1961234 RepID=A0ABD3DT80_9LAMI